MGRRNFAVFCIPDFCGHSYTITNLIKLLYTCFETCFAQCSKKAICRISLNRLSHRLPACDCTFSVSNLCRNSFGSNISSPFYWIHLPVTGSIEEDDDISHNCVDDVLYWGTLDISSIFGAVVGGSVFSFFFFFWFLRVFTCDFKWKHTTDRNIKNFFFPSKSNPAFLKKVFSF